MDFCKIKYTSLTHTFTLSTLTLSHHHTLTLSHHHTLTLTPSHPHTFTPSYPHTLTFTPSLSPPSHSHTIIPSHSHTFTDHPYILPVVTVVNPPSTISTFTEELVRTSAVDIVQPDLLLRRPSSKLPKGRLYGLQESHEKNYTSWYEEKLYKNLQRLNK